MRLGLRGLGIACVLLAALGCAVAAEVEGEQSHRLLMPDPGDALSPCQTFYWRDTPAAEQYWVRAGSCRECTDIAHEDRGRKRSARLRLPADGRPIYFTLYAKTAAGWVSETHRYVAPVADGPVSCGANDPPPVGPYHWAGAATRSMAQGVRAAADMGARSVRLTLSPRYSRDYNIGADCYSGFSLSKVLREPDVMAALADPRVETFMLTVYDGASFGDDCLYQHALQAEFHTDANRQAVIEEYEAFVYELARRFVGSGKEFILSNWEGDNAAYCGAAYQYVHDEAFRASCDADYADYYGGNAGPAETLDALRNWLSDRAAGLERGRQRALEDGYSGVSIRTAIEINIVRALSSAGLPSVLYDVIPDSDFDYVSYSAWESLYGGDTIEALLTADLDAVRHAAGTDAVIAGEVGVAQAAWGDQTVPRLAEALRAAEEWGAPLIFHWLLYDYDETGYGMFDMQERRSPVGQFYRNRFTGRARPRPTGAPIRAGGRSRSVARR